MKKRIAIYPGTFDPMTRGHTDLIKRAAPLFDHLIIAVAEDTNRHTYFSLNERVQLAKAVLSCLKPSVSVEIFSGLLVKFVMEKEAKVILRGIRGWSDFDYECHMASMNRTMAPTIETLFLTPAEPYAKISSTMVRQIAGLKGALKHFVDPVVETALTEKVARTHQER